MYYQMMENQKLPRSPKKGLHGVVVTGPEVNVKWLKDAHFYTRALQVSTYRVGISCVEAVVVRICVISNMSMLTDTEWDI
jgi:hypothetical protein